MTETEEEVSTLVLLKDQEYLLTVSRRFVLFANWSTSVLTPKVITLELKPFLSTNPNTDHQSIGLPCVVTAPFTTRFQLKGPSEIENLCMVYLRCHQPLRYEISFLKPQMEESDFLWDNFQDQLIFQTRLERIVVPLKATKSPDGSELTDDSFVPRTLPSIKAPPLKVLDLIESNEQNKAAMAAIGVQPVRPPSSLTRTSSFGIPRRIDSTSESFHPAKNSVGERLLNPIETPPLSIRGPFLPITASSTEANTNAAVSLSTNVTNQIEAKAVILKMRARHAGSMSCTIHHPTYNGNTSQDIVPEVCSDLEQFHRLVVAAKEEVIKETSKAKNDLDFYKDVLKYQQQQIQQDMGIDPLQSTTSETEKKIQLLKPVPPPPLAVKESKNIEHNQKLQRKVDVLTGKNVVPTSINIKKSITNNQSDVASCRTTTTTTCTPKSITSIQKNVKSLIAVGTGSTTSTKAPVVDGGDVPQLPGLQQQRLGLKAGKLSKTKQRLGEAIRISKTRDMLEEFDDSDPEIDTAPLIPDEVSRRSSMIDLEEEEEDQEY
jgi:hypothetical protein